MFSWQMVFGWTFRIFFSSKTKGPGEKGAPEIQIIQKFRLRNWPVSSADFPMTPMEGTEHRPLVLPAPFVLLLNF